MLTFYFCCFFLGLISLLVCVVFVLNPVYIFAFCFLHYPMEPTVLGIRWHRRNDSLPALIFLPSFSRSLSFTHTLEYQNHMTFSPVSCIIRLLISNFSFWRNLRLDCLLQFLKCAILTPEPLLEQKPFPSPVTNVLGFSLKWEPQRVLSSSCCMHYPSN